MGWADCGVDSNGRPIGYAFEATCDYPGCTATIDRGLAYACGGMHGENGDDCEGYFCYNHLHYAKPAEHDGHFFCPTCVARINAENGEG